MPPRLSQQVTQLPTKALTKMGKTNRPKTVSETTAVTTAVATAAATRDNPLADWAGRVIAELAGKIPCEDLAQLRAQATTLAAGPPLQPSLLPDPAKPSIVSTSGALSELANKLDAAVVIAVDIETSSLNYHEGVIVP